MTIDRRRLFAAFAASAGAAGTAGTAAATPALARDSANPAPRAELDAASLGIWPNAEEDQSAALQRAIERAAATGASLRLPPGVYRAGGLRLPPHAAIAGVAGATRLLMSGGPWLLAATGSDHLNISGLVLDGANIPLADGRGLLHLTNGRAVQIRDCEIIDAGGNGITLEAIAGEITASTINNAADCAIFSNDAVGLSISANTVRGAGNGGILVWRGKPGDDGTLVLDNRIENIKNTRGGSGQWGNAVNIFRANTVIVRGNRIRNAAFSAIRGNSASNLQIAGNTCTEIGEVALFCEFGFEGVLIANNIVDGAAVGAGVANFDKGGRLAVVQGNLIRNLKRGRPPGSDAGDASALGISVEADAAVSGNVVENIPGTGITAGYGPYLRDVVISGNVVRDTDYGIGVSVAPGAGAVTIADNLIAGARRAAIVGKEWDKTVTGDLSQDGAARYAQLSIGGNRVR